jgi:hypothetical protein
LGHVAVCCIVWRALLHVVELHAPRQRVLLTRTYENRPLSFVEIHKNKRLVSAPHLRYCP